MLRIENSATRCFERAVCREAGGPISRQAVRSTTMFASEGKSRSVNSRGLGCSAAGWYGAEIDFDLRRECQQRIRKKERHAGVRCIRRVDDTLILRFEFKVRGRRQERIIRRCQSTGDYAPPRVEFATRFQLRAAVRCSSAQSRPDLR